MVGRRVSAVTADAAMSYITSVKETFHDEPEKYIEFIKLLNSARDDRSNVTSVIARVEELMKDHHNLLHGFNVFLPAEDKRIIIPPGAKSDDTKKNLAYAEYFMNKLKTRFQSLDTHVVGSFCEIMKMFKEGKMSAKKVHEEVIDLLYYHEDLIEDFSRYFTKNNVLVASKSLLVCIEEKRMYRIINEN